MPTDMIRINTIFFDIFTDSSIQDFLNWRVIIIMKLRWHPKTSVFDVLACQHFKKNIHFTV